MGTRKSRKGYNCDINDVAPEILERAKDYAHMGRRELKQLATDALTGQNTLTFQAAIYLITLDSIKRGM